MPYTAELDPELACWFVLHNEREIPGLNCHQDALLARDMATLLTWAEEDRLRHEYFPERS